jgi:drug/metabolite transporter (DMT)-like permease
VALGTGAMFIIVFLITGLAAQRTGVAVASVASKMSMVIPVLAGLWLYNEQLHTAKAIGILLAFPAVFLVSKPSTSEEMKNFRFRDLGLPILLFFGAGLVDTLIKAVQFHFMNEQNKGIIIMMVLGTIGLVRLIFLAFKDRKFIGFKDLLGGIVLGSANFLSLHYLVRCLEYPGAESSHVFTIVNTGVVSLSAVIAAVGFREKFSGAKILGLMLAIGAIVVLSMNA